MEMLYKFVPKLNNQRGLDRMPTVEMGTAIPRLIHQTYSHASKLPAAFSDNIAAIKAMNLEWTHTLYNDEDIEAFILDNYGKSILEYYLRIDATYGAARADLFRYLLMYKKGGVYLDVKSSLLRPLDEVLLESDSFLLSQWHNGKGEEHANWGLHRDLHGIIRGGEYQQWYIACVPGHPFLKAVIENVLNNIDRYNPEMHGVGRNGVLRVTGPIAFTLAIVPILNSHPYRRVDSERDLGFAYTLFAAKAAQEHYPLFTNPHYTKLKGSVVHLTPTKKVVASGLRSAKKVLEFAKRLAEYRNRDRGGPIRS